MCKAVIMAGGEGKRLRPITCTLPKPMVPLLNKPVIDYCIELLKKHGVEDITATLHYLPNVIMRHCGDGDKYGVKLSYSIEDAPLGTAGSVRKAVGADARRTIVISGDAMTDADLTEAMCFHKARGAAVTIVLKRVSVPTEYGVAMTDSKGKIYRFLEKPMLSEVFSDLANTGIYILEPEVIERIPEGEKYDFSKDLFPALLKEKMPVYGYVTDRYWCDIGDIAQYKAAQRDMLDGRCAFTTAAKQKDGAWIEDGAVISEGAELLGPCYIGSGAEVSEAVVSDYSVVGSGARIGRGSSLKRTVLMENARVRENAELRGAILCEGAEVESGASIYSGTVIGSGSGEKLYGMQRSVALAGKRAPGGRGLYRESPMGGGYPEARNNEPNTRLLRQGHDPGARCADRSRLRQKQRQTTPGDSRIHRRQPAGSDAQARRYSGAGITGRGCGRYGLLRIFRIRTRHTGLRLPGRYVYTHGR